VSGRYCRCGSALARDNADRLCAICQARLRRDRAPDVPPEFWQTEPLADALASGDVGRVIRAYRCHPFHGERLPQALVAGWLHMSQPAVCRIETGRRRVTVDEIGHIAQVLGMPVLAVPWTPQQSGEDVDPLSRRSLLGVGVGAALGLGATTAPAAARDIDPELPSHWLSLLGLLSDHDAMFGSSSVRDAVRHEMRLIAKHRHVARGELHGHLLRVEARWSWFAAWLSHDAGDARSADSWSDRALRLAQEVAEPDMVAWVLLHRSQWAATLGDPGRATAFADAAEHTARTNAQIRALCAFKQAHGHALSDDVASCERSLRDAYGRLSHADGTTPWDNQSVHLTAPYVLAEEARCWLRLRPSRAVATFEHVLRDWPKDRTRGRGIHQARLAQACAAANEPERAAAEGIKAVDIARTSKSNLTVRELRRVALHLAGCDVPAVAGFRNAFATL
jgi:hypothetical protein